MSNIKDKNKKQVYMLDEDSIDVERCEAERIRGASFQELGNSYDVSKLAFYCAWNRLKEKKGISYRPIPLASLRASLADQEQSFADIARSYGCTVQGLQNYILDQDIPPRKVDMARVEKMLAEGRSIPACADYYGVSYVTMYSMCRKAGLVSERSRKLNEKKKENGQTENGRLKARIAELEAEVDSLRKRIAELEGRKRKA